MIPQPGPMPNRSANPGDSCTEGGQQVPVSPPYGMRQATSQLILTAAGEPYRTSARFPQKGDDRTYVDIHNLNPYQQVLYTYEGSHGYRDNSFLIYFQREEWYQERQRYSMRSVVAFKSVVDAMVQPVFEKEILRTTNNQMLDQFLKNADNTGTTLQDVNETLQTHARMMGLTFLVMDNFADASKVETVADALNQRKFPYVYEKMPFEVYKWKCNNWGKLEWITFYDRAEILPDPDHAGKFIQRQYYRRWDSASWTKYYEWRNPNKADDIREIVDAGAPHGLNYLPVYPVLDYVKSNNLANFPTPVMADLANMAFILYNVESWILMLDVYCFPTLTLPPMEGTQIAMSAANAIEVPNDAKHAPGYISPPTDCLEVLVRCADRLEEKIYKAANQLGVSGSRTKASVSGVSKEWDFRASNALLTKTAFSARKVEEWCAKTFADYTGNKATTFKCEYPTEFVEAYSQQRLQRAMDLIKENPPENLAKELWCEITKVFFDDDADRAKRIVEEINNKYSQDITDKSRLADADSMASPTNADEDQFKSLINGILGKFKKGGNNGKVRDDRAGEGEGAGRKPPTSVPSGEGSAPLGGNGKGREEKNKKG
jgi:hypothetical protein